MTLFADLLSSVFERRHSFPRIGISGNRPLKELATELIATADEVSGQATAREILSRFESSDDDAKLEFFQHLTTELHIDPEKVRDALADLEADQSKANYRTFVASAEPPRLEVLRRLNQVPGATEKLVKMRVDLRRLSKKDPALEMLDTDFRQLFASWFNRGFLVLRPINWESPAHILEKIIAYEAVHAIDSWDDLRRRLAPADRRCFAFFHPVMPDEPLIFVEVALTQGIPSSIQHLLAENREPMEPEQANSAVFYSISNCQAGLAGISFGNSLIKQVVADLRVELPGLKKFVTLSPIPGLNSWLEHHEIDREAMESDDLRKLAAYYLVNAKGANGFPQDSVARFHLNNGAIVHQVHADADVSAKGQKQSSGMMVNYLYELDNVSRNHEKYASVKEIVASRQVSSLASSAKAPESV